MSDQEFSRREKEIISVGASVAAGCQPCTRHHVAEARAAGVSDREIRLGGWCETRVLTG
jgi:AhpD family alkylhydroperoxidase